MEPIAVCIVTKDEYFLTRYCIENLMAKTELPVKLYVFNNNSQDSKTSVMMDELLNQGHYIATSKVDFKIHDAYNYLLKEVTEKYVCLLQTNILVSPNWLEDLISNYNSIPSSGIIGISQGQKLKGLSLTKRYGNTDELTTVWINENMFIDGLMFFNTERNFGLLGHEEVPESFTCEEFCNRSLNKGLHNYFIRNQNIVKVMMGNDKSIFPKKTREDFNKFSDFLNQKLKTQLYE